MSESVFISICIPAYKNTDYLKRLLDSVSVQTFKDFEVVITDDSPDDSVNNFIKEYKISAQLIYQKNATALGTPGNWNEAIRLASGKWIKLMHDDDWFANENSLDVFAGLALKNANAEFIYSAYSNVNLDTNEKKLMKPSGFERRVLKNNAAVLFAKNSIGPPSAVLYKNKRDISYDTHLKWLVDIDFYIRYLQNSKAVYISEPLVNIGISKLQVTRESSRVREVEIPESFMVGEKTGFGHLRNILVFDAWWRIIRNFSIKSEQDVRSAGYEGEIPAVIQRIIRFQKQFPRFVLTTGLFSKFFMFVAYLVIKKG